MEQPALSTNHWEIVRRKHQQAGVVLAIYSLSGLLLAGFSISYQAGPGGAAILLIIPTAVSLLIASVVWRAWKPNSGLLWGKILPGFGAFMLFINFVCLLELSHDLRQPARTYSDLSRTQTYGLLTVLIGVFAVLSAVAAVFIVRALLSQGEVKSSKVGKNAALPTTRSDDA